MVLEWFLEDEKKPRRKAIPKAVKQTVWNKYIGVTNAEGKCYVCKRTIHMSDFDVGHNKAASKGGRDQIDNLRPICRTCNSSMGTMSIEAFKKKYFIPQSQKTVIKTTPNTKATGRIQQKTPAQMTAREYRSYLGKKPSEMTSREHETYQRKLDKEEWKKILG